MGGVGGQGRFQGHGVTVGGTGVLAQGDHLDLTGPAGFEAIQRHRRRIAHHDDLVNGALGQGAGDELLQVAEAIAVGDGNDRGFALHEETLQRALVLGQARSRWLTGAAADN